MNQNSSLFSMHSPMQLLETPEGRQLMLALQHADPSVLQKAIEALKTGNGDLAIHILEPYMKGQDLTKLLQGLQGGAKNG